MKHKKMIITIIIFTILIIGVFVVLQHPSFGRLPQGARLERIKKSQNYKDGMFVNQEVTPIATSGKSIWHQIISFITKSRPDNITPNEKIKSVKTDLSKLNKNEDIYVWFGHSSYLLQEGGKRFLVDPVLTNCFPSSFMLKPFKGSDIYSPKDIPSIDYLIITHDHWDHLDYNTIIEIIDKVGHVICPLGIGEYFEYWGYPMERIIEMDWNESYEVDETLIIHCLPSRHYSGRSFKRNPTLWASFMIDGKRKIYLGADGGYGKHFKNIGDEFFGVDLAILENGQYDKDWCYIHMLPDQLPLAIEDLKASKVITVHHNKFALARHSWNEPEVKIEENSKSKSYELLTPIIGDVCKY